MKRICLKTCSLLAALFSILGSSSASYLNGGLTSVAVAPGGGYWVQVTDFGYRGDTLAVDGAPDLGTIHAAGTIISAHGRIGYWIVFFDGSFGAFGDAPQLCPFRCFTTLPNSETVVSAAVSPDEKGLWALTAKGHVYTSGTAQSYGDVSKDSAPNAAIVVTPSGKGYYIAKGDGGVYSFGDAVFHGSFGGKTPGGKQITGMALSLNAAGEVSGYWLVAEDGGVFSFGGATFLGSSGGDEDPHGFVSNMVALPYGRGYAWVHGDGDVQVSRLLPRVTINSKLSGKNVDVQGGTSEAGERLIQTTPDTSSLSQQWDVFPAGSDGKVQLVNVNSRFCMDVSASDFPDIIQWPCKGPSNDWDNQRWTQKESAFGILFQPVSAPDDFLGALSKTEGDFITLYTSQEFTNPNAVSWKAVEVAH